MTYKQVCVLAALCLGAGLAGCGSSGNPPIVCEKPTDCPVVECQVNTCEAMECGSTPAADGTTCKTPDNKAGTCSAGACKEGSTPACTPATVGTDCPAPAACKVATCVSGACGTDDAGDGTSCNGGAGECQSGACVEACSADADCDDANECTTNTCSNSMCATSNVADGTACGTGGEKTCMGGVCRGGGGETPAPQTVTFCLYCANVPIVGNVAIPAQATVTPMGAVTAGGTVDVAYEANTALTIPLDAMATLNTGSADYSVGGATPATVTAAVPMQTLNITANVPTPVDGGSGLSTLTVGASATAVTVGASSIFLDISITSPFPIELPLTCMPIDASDPSVMGAAIDGCTGEVDPGPPPAASFDVQ
ncbi:MAG: hypothetical protein KC543_06700 [Myxococcales bacterium]|nr:hypothetical protein [Myxococcales bacterium]